MNVEQKRFMYEDIGALERPMADTWLQMHEQVSIPTLSEFIRAGNNGAGNKGFYRFPIVMQLEDLGLTPESIAQLSRNNARVLDVGCGKTADLVRLLRKKGIRAEGIDAELSEENDFLMRKNVTGFKPLPGHIPRPDGHYDLILQNSAVAMIQPLTPEVSEGDPRIYTSVLGYLDCIRVLKDTGRMIIYPQLTRTTAIQMQIKKDGWALHEEKVDRQGEELPDLIAQHEFLQKRTVIYKP